METIIYKQQQANQKLFDPKKFERKMDSKDERPENKSKTNLFLLQSLLSQTCQREWTREMWKKLTQPK